MSSSLHKRLMRGGIPSGLPPRMPGHVGPSSSTRVRGRNYKPLAWNTYFEQCRKVTVDTEEITVYEIGSEGPILLLLHGGGFSGLTWACFAKEITAKVKCRVLAPDLRGHGDTKSNDDLDLSPETVANDLKRLLEKRFEGTDIPPVILIGHSMGGALAVHTALGDLPFSVLGLVVIDVVEGTALDALCSMQAFLRCRPDRFKSLEQAIEWSIRSGQVRNAESARVSMPGQLKSRTSGECATRHVERELQASKEDDSQTTHQTSLLPPADSIAEEEEEESAREAPSQPMPPPRETNPTAGYTWRINLSETECHWQSWFQSLSSKFLSVPASKLLLLAGVDRLDRDLTVGQMQGKFQMQVLPQAGHAVHEDVPDRVADVVASFLVRNKFAEENEGFQKTFPSC